MGILNIGSGPVPETPIPGLEITHADSKDRGPNVEFQNMEALSYPRNSFHVVFCINALDHTKNARKAVDELIRVCKPGGLVYIDCSLIQHTTSGGWHYWDMTEDGTMFMYTSNNDLVSNMTFNLSDLGFKVDFIDNKGERRYNKVIATYQKEMTDHA